MFIHLKWLCIYCVNNILFISIWLIAHEVSISKFYLWITFNQYLLLYTVNRISSHYWPFHHTRIWSKSTKGHLTERNQKYALITCIALNFHPYAHIIQKLIQYSDFKILCSEIVNVSALVMNVWIFRWQTQPFCMVCVACPIACACSYLATKNNTCVLWLGTQTIVKRIIA